MMREEIIQIALPAGCVPSSLWLPSAGVRAVVLMGHGLGVDRYHESIRIAAELLTVRGFAVLAPDVPMHGERRTAATMEATAIVQTWQTYWATGGVQALKVEWSGILDYAADRFPELPMGYFGLSLGTQYGIVFLARNQRIRAAVLGLFGSLPRPMSKVMNELAPEVTCPVAFLKQLNDEIHPSETVDHLYRSLGSTTKVLIATPGKHAAVPEASFREACGFLAEHLASD